MPAKWQSRRRLCRAELPGAEPGRVQMPGRELHLGGGGGGHKLVELRPAAAPTLQHGVEVLGLQVRAHVLAYSCSRDYQ